MARTYRQLSMQEREEISRGLSAGRSERAIAASISRSASTVHREIRRNGPSRRRYRCEGAHAVARARSSKARRTRKLACVRLWQFVRTQLRHRRSPEQIAGRLRHDYPAMVEKHISHETIYRAIYVLPRGELRAQLIACLRRAKPRRGPKGWARGSGPIPSPVSIHERPLIVEDREQSGHWEGDLIRGKQNRSAIATLVERKSRYLMLVPLTRFSAYDVRKAMERRFARLPVSMRRTMTYDRGSEMAEHERLRARINLEVYFADPHSPWQRGTNENTNGLLRQYFPKGVDLSAFSPAQINAVQHEMNDRPRKVLGYATPREVLTEELRRAAAALES